MCAFKFWIFYLQIIIFCISTSFISRYPALYYHRTSVFVVVNCFFVVFFANGTLSIHSKAFCYKYLSFMTLTNVCPSETWHSYSMEVNLFPHLLCSTSFSL